ncbi:hypothetical protein [Pseudovibrio sp. POLY-S9]|uniref:hypothetical protein n=1 Tax=Pseudovibrio sp. POLY-S9 TaxID=1576596 RepID=UPI0007092061|nr:hypothetical protein [Pseudovibrio sp. POLY-S9]
MALTATLAVFLVLGLFVVRAFANSITLQMQAYKHASDIFYERAQDLMNYDCVSIEILSTVAMYSKLINKRSASVILLKILKDDSPIQETEKSHAIQEQLTKDPELEKLYYRMLIQGTYAMSLATPIIGMSTVNALMSIISPEEDDRKSEIAPVGMTLLTRNKEFSKLKASDWFANTRAA